jgi:hypothetical protein
MISIQITGLEEINDAFKKAPEFIVECIGQALMNSIAMVETEAKRLTPVDTGLLRSSIGGEQGWSYVEGLTAGVGTNVKYAFFVETGNAKHKVGQSHFMETGAKNATNYIQSEMEKAMEKLANKLVNK